MKAVTNLQLTLSRSTFPENWREETNGVSDFNRFRPFSPSSSLLRIPKQRNNVVAIRWPSGPYTGVKSSRCARQKGRNHESSPTTTRGSQRSTAHLHYGNSHSPIQSTAHPVEIPAERKVLRQMHFKTGSLPLSLRRRLHLEVFRSIPRSLYVDSYHTLSQTDAN